MGNFTHNLLRNQTFTSARIALEKLRTMDPRAAESAELWRILSLPVLRYTVKAQKFPPGLRLWRGRNCDRPANLKELSYPPANYAKLGRANREGRPVLYCCASREAAVFEVRPEVGQTIALVQWITTSPLMVNVVGYSHNTFSRLGSTRRDAHLWSTQARADAMSDEITAVFSELFTQDSGADSSAYHLTAAIADFFMEGPTLHGVLYPTMAMKGNSDNMALKPDFADAHLQMRRTQLIRVDAIHDFSYDVTILDTARSSDPNGDIKWRGRQEQWTLGDQLVMSVEDGEWVARDKAGKIVEPE